MPAADEARRAPRLRRERPRGARVYEGTHGGQRVAVKVVHPASREAVETDMALLAFCVGCGERPCSEARAGADAGRLILGAHANRGDFGAIDRESEARFVTGIDEMVARSRDQPIFESMAEYMSTICGLAVSHRVVLDASFVSAQMARSSQRELGRLSAWSRGVLEDIKAKEARLGQGE
ncbi:aarF domain-containing kinase [Aureococcus anophagefferens]|uniref:AarF domain-containing kinase n=1 Tax=Aureococcus anophagefferens TaxID=44056 RepID=A0ABR1FQM1_AURAN